MGSDRDTGSFTVVDTENLIRRATEEADRTLIALALDRTPMERLRAATLAARALARFHRVPSQNG